MLLTIGNTARNIDIADGTIPDGGGLSNGRPMAFALQMLLQRVFVGANCVAVEAKQRGVVAVAAIVLMAGTKVLNARTESPVTSHAV